MNTAFLNKKNDKCLIIIANTIKGKGTKRMESKSNSHYAKISSIQSKKWKKQVTFQYEQHTLN
ncbi:hypothetical protein DS830_02860 [Bombilactobacillus bombi]|nr:hypothetical protein DS830_02860 [Bombilactobacillus bombi]